MRPVWPGGHAYAETQSERPEGLPITWHEMAALANSCQQIIDGRFTGYDEEGQPALQLQAVDSSYWIVWAADAEELAAVRAAFSAAENYDEPMPKVCPAAPEG